MKLCLIVDDFEVIRKVVRSVMEELGYIVVEAFSIEEASRVIDEEMPNLIIADWSMPDGSTHDFIASVRAMHPPVEPCIIYLVTENNAEDITAALNAGANDYVMKPFERTVLQEKVKKIAGDLPAFATAE